MHKKSSDKLAIDAVYQRKVAYLWQICKILLRFYIRKVTKVLTVVIVKESAVNGGYVRIQSLFCGNVRVGNYGFVQVIHRI